MKLTRNVTKDGRGKYALIRLDKVRALPQGGKSEKSIAKALAILGALGVLEYGEKGSEDEFFVLKLKDIYAATALQRYAYNVATAPGAVDDEYAQEMLDLVVRARRHKNRRKPD